MIFTRAKIVVFGIYLVICGNQFRAETQHLNCQAPSRITFEKLIGIRPNPTVKSTLLYRSRNNSPATLECISHCAYTQNCTGFLLFYNSSTCYSYVEPNLGAENYDYDSKTDSNVVWFRKTCLNVPHTCERKAWTFEIVAGATIVGRSTKKIKDRVSRQRCIEYCLQETTFDCKSIKFHLITKLMDKTIANPVGICVLSETDRHLTPQAFRVSRYEDEYIENQCVNTTHSPEFCAYEEYENSMLDHTDLSFNNVSQQECEHICDTSLTFNCRGYSTVPLKLAGISPNISCLLHTEDSKLVGPKLLDDYKGAKYYERARCLNVSVSCSSNQMTIKYTPEDYFNGKIYISGYSEIKPCYATGAHLEMVQINLPLNSSFCGLTEARTAEPWNRTLKSVLLVVQYNSLIQTQSDRLLKVGCVYGNDDEREVTLGATVNFTSTFPNRGSTVINSSTVLPIITMKIIDYNTKQPVRDTEIGQELQMVIEITPGDGPYDIWAGDLIATSGNNTLQLLDESGCPTYINIFSPFIKVSTNSSRMLISNFQAFKFPSNPLVRFNVMVHFCTVTCPAMECVTEESEQRNKRETHSKSAYQITSDIINATVYKIKGRKNTDNDTDGLDEEMPLDIVLYVRGVNISPDQLVYGENNKILIAGYDYITNEVCLDYNLLIGLLVMWVILQVIIIVCCFLLIRKYKKYFHIAYTRQLDDMHQNFGFGSRELNRRVHWADQ